MIEVLSRIAAERSMDLKTALETGAIALDPATGDAILKLVIAAKDSGALDLDLAL